MSFRELSESEYCNFIDGLTKVPFVQMPVVGKASGIKMKYFGLLDETGAVKVAGLVRLYPWKKIFSRANLIFGPVMETFNREEMFTFIRELITVLKKDPRVIRLRINPEVELKYYNDIEFVGTDAEAEKFVADLENFGFRKHPGTLYTHRGLQVNKVYVRDFEPGATWPEIMKTFPQDVKTYFNRLGTPGLHVAAVGKEELPEFEKILEHTVDRREKMAEIGSEHFEYYGRLIEAMPEDAFIMQSWVDRAEYLAGVEAEIAQINEELEGIAEFEAALPEGRTLAKRFVAARNEANTKLASLEKRRKAALELPEQAGNKIVLAMALFIRSKQELVYLTAGSYRDYQFFQGTYLIHRVMMEWAVNNGVTRYNTYGVSGDLSETAPDPGILEFKRKFRGNMLEYIGTFDYLLQPLVAKLVGGNEL